MKIKMNKEKEQICFDCGKVKLPIGKSMYDDKWRCIMCNRKFLRKIDGVTIGDKITFEEHILIGKALKIINHKVLNNQRERYKTKSEERKSYELKAFRLDGELKNIMEEIMAKDYPNLWDTNIYYGGGK